ncbi:MAG: hypothetical protein EB127_08985 [Alphaproteobacteria bacterium]|nr:hypothetical protein [Alphaproteobacteria bacterium]
MSELELADRWERINKVVEVFLKGVTNPTFIARETGFKRAEVQEYLNEWRSVIHSDKLIQARAREALAGADQHYSMLIQEAWNVVEQSNQQNALSQKTAALKLIADIQQKQIDMLQKAGLIENNEIADQILETERKQEILVGILKEVVSDCEHCRREVSKRLSEVTGKVEGY